MLLFFHLLRLSRPPSSACFSAFRSCLLARSLYDLYRSIPSTPNSCLHAIPSSQSSAALFIPLDQSRQRLFFTFCLIIIIIFRWSLFFLSSHPLSPGLALRVFHHHRSQPVHYCLTTRSNSASDGVKHVASSFSSLLSLFRARFHCGFDVLRTRLGLELFLPSLSFFFSHSLFPSLSFSFQPSVHHLLYTLLDRLDVPANKTPSTSDSQVTNIKTKTVKMPKEKTTARKTKRGVEKKKKGKLILFSLCTQAMANRRTVDPNAPKRGLSAYMIFANEQRAAVREENPNITFGRSSFFFSLVFIKRDIERNRKRLTCPCRPSWQGPRRAVEGPERQAASPL